jgi:ATP-dependent exoDNAse (exonuclease V) alpha subunit
LRGKKTQELFLSDSSLPSSKKYTHRRQVLSPVRAGALGTRRIGAFVRDLLNPVPRPGGGGGGGGADLVLPGGGGGSGENRVEGQPPPPPLTLRRGDKVMQTTNNYDSDVFNGEVG